jgi:predicted SAM-dependent methyltransferase
MMNEYIKLKNCFKYHIMKLHIGGEATKVGWKILNISQKPGVDFIGDMSDLSMFENDSASWKSIY